MLTSMLTPETQELLKTLLIASGFGVGFFVMKGLYILKFPFELLFNALTTKLSFTNNMWVSQEMYNNISKKILDSKKFMFRSVTPMYGTNSSDNRRGKMISPGQGWFFCILNGRLAFVRTQELNKEFEQQMLIHITWFTRDDARLSALMLELKKVIPDEVIVNYLSTDGYWVPLGQRPKRYFDTVFYESNLKKEIIDHYSSVKESREDNIKLGVIPKTVKLFYGPPGTGKTSFGIVLATEFDKDIYIINTANVSDDTFIKAIQQIPDISRALILFEDIDNNASLYDRNKYTNAEDILVDGEENEKEVLGKRKKIKAGTRVSLNTMLNFLDGMITPKDLDVAITTNHLEKLDPALYRPSRVNFLKEITPLGPNSVCDFIEFYYKTRLTDEERNMILRVKKPVLGSELMNMYQDGAEVGYIIDSICNENPSLTEHSRGEQL